MRSPVDVEPARLLVLPVLGYSFLALLLTLVPISGLALAGILAAAVPLAALLAGRSQSALIFAPLAAWLAGVLLVLGEGGAPTTPGGELLGGLLLGAPLVLAACVLWPARGSPLLLPLTGVAIVDAMTNSAALARLGAGGLAATPGNYLGAFLSVSSDQLGGWADLVGGASSAPLPLQLFTDPVLASLALLALVGAFLAFVAPGIPEGEPADRPSPTLILSASAGALAAAAFELVAAGAPRFALLGLAAAVVAVLGAILLLARAPPAPRVRTAPAPRSADRTPATSAR